MTERPPNAASHASASAGLLESIWRIGADSRDDDEERLQKRLLVASTVMMASLAVLWGAIYLAFNQPVAAAIPLSYSVASFASITKDSLSEI